MFKTNVKYAIGIVLAVSIAAGADSLPGGWTLGDDGVVTKGTSYVQMFDKAELDGLNSTEYMRASKSLRIEPAMLSSMFRKSKVVNMSFNSHALSSVTVFPPARF